MNPAAQAVGSILRFDKKVNSYKLALVRALNDVVLSYPDLSGKGVDVCVPLRKLAEYWLAYYWPFADPQDPILQGPRATRRAVLGNDLSFRPAVTDLRTAWTAHFGTARPSDGFLLVAELAVIIGTTSAVEDITQQSIFGFMFLGRPLLYAIFVVTLALPTRSEEVGESDTVNAVDRST